MALSSLGISYLQRQFRYKNMTVHQLEENDRLLDKTRNQAYLIRSQVKFLASFPFSDYFQNLNHNKS